MLAQHATVPLIAAVFVFGGISLSNAACVPKNLPNPPPQDPLAHVLKAQTTCPKSAVEFVEMLERSGARLEPTMVNFLGFHDPNDGAFFIFEIVSNDSASSSADRISRGDLMFGHFTKAEKNTLVSDEDGNLIVEVIAWDAAKKFNNFYELTKRDGWVYRGDSKDILDDITHLYRQRHDSEPPFGTKLRCSGCHINGALIQKELTPPFNDWFVHKHPLPLGTLKPDEFVQKRLAALVDADELSKQVVASARRLAESPGYRKVLSERGMQEQLRPLFCPMELNIESDAEPVDDVTPPLRIPSAFFVDPRLATADIRIKRSDYDTALEKMHSKLPDGSDRADADHGWLTPVKAKSDMIAIESLVERGIITNEFAIAVLSVDFTNPLFSKKRCNLLKVVPDQGGPDFMDRFKKALASTSLPGASELLGNLSNPTEHASRSLEQAQAFLGACQQRAADSEAVLGWYKLLVQRRIEVTKSEISKNPNGHILENEKNGGRIVFPTSAPQPTQLELTLECQIRAAQQ